MHKGQVIVTGASRGIGEGVAAELDRRGFAVVALSRSGTSPVGVGMRCDMANEAEIKAVVAEIAQNGPIIGLVNNAGVQVATPSAELSLDAFEESMRLNVGGALVASREVYPALKQAGGGLIVNMGSFYDKIGVPRNLAYCASKAAMGAMTRCLAVEWARDGIRVLNVAPGYVATELNRDFFAKPKIQDWIQKDIPVGRAGEVSEIASFIGMLFAERVPYLTGETIYIDGGHGMSQL
jgi:NAD(P)-dependent dehydrogenase (short-subunit alcohol dehydrogenase family)